MATRTNSNAFGQQVDTDNNPRPDVAGFDLDAFIRGTALITRTVEVCGKPQLMGVIEDLKAQLERPDISDVDDDRPMAPSPALAIARELEATREEMLASVARWKFRALRNGEIEKIRAETSDDTTVIGRYGEGTELTEFDYRCWAAQVVAINGSPVTATWEQLHALHTGVEGGTPGLGAYFMQTIARTANLANSGVGVDAPFSLKSSALIAKQSKT